MKIQKLSLHKESLRTLSAAEAEAVDGGLIIRDLSYRICTYFNCPLVTLDPMKCPSIVPTCVC
jgi:hypothetical protein